MNWLCCILFISLLTPVSGCSQHYELLTLPGFKSYFNPVVIDSSSHAVVFQVSINDGRSIAPPPSRIIIRRTVDRQPSHYLIAPYSRLKDDSTVLCFSSLFQYSTNPEILEWPEGRWMYVSFPDAGSANGIRYHPDSLPHGLPISLNLPSARGIYLYASGELKPLTADQSEESFIKLQKTGFYFLPAPGTFYYELDIRSIK